MSLKVSRKLSTPNIKRGVTWLQVQVQLKITCITPCNPIQNDLLLCNSYTELFTCLRSIEIKFDGQTTTHQRAKPELHMLVRWPNFLNFTIFYVFFYIYGYSRCDYIFQVTSYKIIHLRNWNLLTKKPKINNKWSYCNLIKQ